MPIKPELDEQAKKIKDQDTYKLIKGVTGTLADTYRWQELFVKMALKIQDLEKVVQSLTKGSISDG